MNKAREETQPLFYIAALNQAGLPVNWKFRHYVFVKGSKPTVQVFETTRNATGLFQLFQQIIDVYHAIQNKAFPCNTSSWKCSERWCEYWHLVPGQIIDTLGEGGRVNARLQFTPHPQGISVTTPYDAAFVAAFQSQIPATSRKWDPDTKTWIVSTQCGALVADLIRQHFGQQVNVPAATTTKTETRMPPGIPRGGEGPGRRHRKRVWLDGRRLECCVSHHLDHCNLVA